MTFGNFTGANTILGAIGTGGLEQSFAVPTRCVTCDAEVRTRGTYCPPCAERESKSLRELYLERASATLPEPYPKATVHPALRAVAADWKRAHGNLVLLGASGTGKTTAMILLAWRILHLAQTRDIGVDDVRWAAGIRFMTAAELGKARIEHALGKSPPPLVRTAERATLLLLDNLGAEKRDDTDIAEVLNERYAACGKLPTVVSTELTRAKLEQRYGVATTRRMMTGRVVDLHSEGAP